MNKRQAKKEKKKESLCGTYREDRLMMRMYREHENSQRRSRTIPEDIEILVELGIYTEEELANKIHRKEKRRWRQLLKFKGSR